MSAYLYFNPEGALASSSANDTPAPTGWTRQTITDAEYAQLQDGTLTWDGGLVPTNKALLAANQTTIRDRAASALASNATYLAIPAPTAAESREQVTQLTRQTNALIRLVLDLYDSTD